MTSTAGPANSAPASGGNSIIPSTGISHLAKLLFVTSKLHTRNLISKEEKRILKQLAIRGDSSILSIDLSNENFLTQLIDTASSIAITQASHTFNNFLFRDCSTNHGKTLSKAERKEKDIKDNSFVYGEIDFHSFSQIIKEIRPLFKPDGVFVDLGSGTGRPCFAMALLSDCTKIIGIEALESLTDVSRDILEKYQTFIESADIELDEDETDNPDATGNSPPRPTQPKKKIINSPLAKLERRHASVDGIDKRIEIIKGDFLEVPWSHADFVFMNSTCYSPPLIGAISRKAEELKPGAIVVSLTKSLTSKEFTVVSKQKKVMSWGAATAYVQKRN